MLMSPTNETNFSGGKPNNNRLRVGKGSYANLSQAAINVRGAMTPSRYSYNPACSSTMKDLGNVQYEPSNYAIRKIENSFSKLC